MNDLLVGIGVISDLLVGICICVGVINDLLVGVGIGIGVMNDLFIGVIIDFLVGIYIVVVMTYLLVIPIVVDLISVVIELLPLFTISIPAFAMIPVFKTVISRFVMTIQSMGFMVSIEFLMIPVMIMIPICEWL